MANKKEYEIIINGITEATQNVETLGDALNRLNSTVETHSEGIKKSSSSIDELAKTEQKITQYNEEYNKALQTNKAVLADKNKAIKEELDLEKANITVQEGIQGSYREKQQLLTALGKVIKNTNAQTDEEKEKLNQLKSQYANINQELKTFDAELGNHQRNVGNYGLALKDLKDKLREGTAELAAMRAQGISESDEAFQKLAKEVGKTKDAIDDARAAAKRFASDTKVLDDVVNVAQSATAAFQLWKGAMTAFNIENEEATKTIQQLISVMSVVQGLQTFTKTLQSGTATSLLLSKASKALKLDLIAQDAAAISAARSQEGLTVAQKAGTIATKTLSMAIKAIPLMFVIGLVTTLITHWEDLVGWFDKTFPALKKVGGLMNGLKGVCVGLGKAILNWIVNPFKTMADVMSKLFEGDFKGAMNAAMDGIKNQFEGTAKAFKEGFQGVIEDGLEEISQKAMEESNKQTKYQLDMLKAQKGNQAKYSKEGIALQKKDYEERRKLAKGNQEELRKINIEEANFQRECEEEKTRVAEAEQQKRTAAARKAAEERKRLEQERQKQAEAEEKQRKDNIKINEDYASVQYKINLELLKQDKKALELKAERYKTSDPLKYLEVMNQLLKKTQEITRIEKGLEENAILNSLISDDANFDSYLKVYAGKISSTIAAEMLKRGDASPLEEWLVGRGWKLEKATEKAKEVFDAINTYAKTVEKPELFSEEELKRAEEGFKKAVDEVSNMTKVAKINELASLLNNDEFAFFETIKKDLNLSDEAAKRFATSIKNYMLIAQQEVGELGDNLDDNFTQTLEGMEKSLSNMESEAQTTFDNVIADVQNFNADPVFRKDVFGYIFKAIDVDATNKKLDKIKDHWKKSADEFGRIYTIAQTRWNEYLDAVAEKYGEESDQYKAALKKKEEALKHFFDIWQTYQEKMKEGYTTSGKKGQGSDVNADGKTDVQRTSRKRDEEGYTDWSALWDADGELWKNLDNLANTFYENVFDPISEAFSALLEFEIEEAQEALDKATQMHDKSVEQVEASKNRLNEISEQMKNANASELESLKSKQADEMLLLAQREAEEKRLAKEKERREKELEKKQRQQKKLELNMELVEGIINTAVGVTKALTWGFPLGPVFAAIIGAMGAVQTALIAKQISKLEDGGLLKGRSHANGGMRIQGTNIEVEGGEYVVNKRSTKKYLPLLQAINEEGRTASYSKPIASHQMLKYANGGELNYQRIDSNLGTMDTNKVIQNTIGDIDMHPVVSVVDINRGVKNLTQVRQMAGASR